MHLAFPRANLTWLAIPALAGLFASWMSLAPRAAASAGYAAGLVFFALDFSWFGETAGASLGWFAFILDLGPALIEALAFALAAALVSIAARTLRGSWIVLASAAAFTATEWLRSSSDLGVPLYPLSAPFVATPLAAIIAFAGSPGLTLTIAFAAAFLACALLWRTRGALLAGAIGWMVLAAIALGAWYAWPARTLAAPTIRVAAVQANIKQSLKWEPASLDVSVNRHIALTESIAAFHPQLIVWPETVITTIMLLDPVLAANPANAEITREGATLRTRFGALAQRMNAQLILGSVEQTTEHQYNDLFAFNPDGSLAAVYRKRRLVPFAEYLPGPRWMRNLPLASLVSDFGHGTDPAVIAPLGVAPLICWDANFGELAQAQAARGARIFAVATDDAWFGTTDGPEAHAQLTQLRAVETGRWIVRAAATGVSGIIAPDGRWRERSDVGVQTVVTGLAGDPVPTVYANLGPLPVGLAILALGALAFTAGRRRA